jgi:hypothetical protein
MIYLRAYGALDRSTAFDMPFDMREVYRLDLSTQFLRDSVQKSLEIVESRGSDPELANALRKVLNRPAWRTKLRSTAHNLRKKVSRGRR